MKYRNLTFLFFFFMVLTSYSQTKEESKFRFRSASLGLGICAGEINEGGVSVYLDATTEYDKNLFSFTYSTGAELNLFDASRNYYEYALLYGREVSVSRIIKLESSLGLAYFNVIYKNGATDFKKISESVVGVPLKLKLLFYVSKNMALGLNPNVTFNSIENTYSAHLVIQYKF